MYEEDDVRVCVCAEGWLQLDHDTEISRLEPYLDDLKVLEVSPRDDGQTDYKIEFSTYQDVSGALWDWAIEKRPSAIDEDLKGSLDAFSDELRGTCQEAGFYAYLEVDKVLSWE